MPACIEGAINGVGAVPFERIAAASDCAALIGQPTDRVDSMRRRPASSGRKCDLVLAEAPGVTGHVASRTPELILKAAMYLAVDCSALVDIPIIAIRATRFGPLLGPASASY